MDCQIKDLLPEFVLGALALPEMEAVEAHLPGCAYCRAELLSLQDGLLALVEDLPRLSVPAPATNKLFQLVEGPYRYDPFIDTISGFFEISSERSERYLRGLRQTEGWVPGPAERIWVLPVEPGKRWSDAKALTAFVRLEPGVRFPRHRHINGEERVFLVDGAYRDESGEVVKRGEYVALPDDHTHDLVAIGDSICIGAVIHFGHDYENLKPLQK